MALFKFNRDPEKKRKKDKTVPAQKVQKQQDTYDIDYRVLTGVLTDLDQIRQTGAQLNDRRIAYNAMSQLKSNAIIGPTLEIYATNATCTNPNGDVIWATAVNDSETAIQACKAANARIKAWKLNWRAYAHMLELITYGNLYIKTTEFVNPATTDTARANNAIINLNQRNPNEHWDVLMGSCVDPSIIYELRHGDEPNAFVVDFGQSDNSYTQWCVINSNNWSVQSSDSVIHIVYNLSLYGKQIEVEDAEGTTTYDIYEGTPPFIDAYTPAQILSLLEDALVANRVTRSALLRILQIEIGDSSPQEEDRILDKLQRSIEHKLSADTNTGQTNSYADPGPLEKIIYTATRNGKGVINLQTLGGDVNVRDIVDLDYYKDKITSITDVSPGNLGQSTDESGTGGATILIQNNIRLYRKVRSLQHCYEEGIKEALNTYFRKNNLPQYCDMFDVEMEAPIGPEDATKSDLANNAITRANDIIALLESLGITDSRIKIEAIRNQLDQIDSSIYNIIRSEEITTEDVAADEGGSGGGMFE